MTEADMRNPQLLSHYGKPGLVAPRAWEASLSGECPTFSCSIWVFQKAAHPEDIDMMSSY